MCELSILSFGSQWVLLDSDDSEIGQYASRAAALSAARSFLGTSPTTFASVLVGEGDGEWCEEHIAAPTPH